MLIRQLFAPERNPTRALNEVVNAEAEIDPRAEIDEYVFTDHTRDYLRTLVDGILDTSQGVLPDCLRGWIAGFFGSGKSHFLKLAAALLENRRLDLGGGLEQRALEYATGRHNLDLPWQRLAKEFRVRAVTVNLAMAHGGGLQAQEKPLLYRLAREINRAWGYSAVPHVADIEREIEKARKWEQFLQAVRKHTETTEDLDPGGKPYEWTHPDIRDMAWDAHRVLEAVLPGILPKYQRPREYLKDREAVQPDPGAVVDLAVAFAASLHPDLGRVLLCVDEIALYLKGGAIGFDADRVREVQGLAEAVRNRGKGKVFLLTTAQLRVDTIDSAFARVSDYVIFLRDRFPPGGRLELEERDIDTVVRERWLRKDPSAPDFGSLERLLKDHGGLLARATKLSDENLIREADGLTDAKAVLAYYPCLPYHIRLLQAILEGLRGEQQIDQTAAQSRALLTAVRSLFVPQNGANIAEAEIGTLVTFDRVYDVIRDVVRKADNATDRWITETIESSMGSCGNIRVSGVAKVIFLLQRLNPHGQRRVRVSAENIASLLYPRLGAPWEPHLADVREACEKLLAEHFIGEEPDTGYRFYRPEEKTFQQEVAQTAVEETRVRELLEKTIAAEVASLGLRNVSLSGGHKLDAEVGVHIDGAGLPDPHAPPKGLEIRVIWPRAGIAPQQTRLWTAQYTSSPHVVLWVLQGGPDADDLARNVLKLEGAIREYSKRHGTQAVDFLRGEQSKLDRLRDEALPQAVRAAITSSIVIHRGVDTALAGTGRKPQEVLRDTLRDAASQVFTQFEDGGVVFDEAGLRKVLTWRPPQPQPDFFAALKLFDADGHSLVDRPFLKEITLALRGRTEADRTGKAVLGHFEAAPYGWPERAVKAGLAALLRGRRLVVRLQDGGTIRSEADPKAESWLTSTQQFNRSVIELSELVITAEERELLGRLFERVLGTPGLDTLEKLEREAREGLPRHLARAREALADLRGRQLPGAEAVGTLVRVLEAAAEPDLPAGRLKQFATEAREASPPGEDPVQALEGVAGIVAAVEKLRTQGRLDLLTSIRGRATGLYASWERERGGGDVRADLAALRAQAGGDALLTHADGAIERDARVFDAYARDYRERHSRRHERAVEARDRVEAHPGWDRAEPALRERLRRGIADLDCESPASLTLAATPDGLCRDCRADFGDLKTDLELLDSREAKALAELDALLAPPPPLPPSLPEVTMVLRSVDDLPALYHQIKAAAEKALTKPRRVRVTFEDPAP
jgi:hypothetical protein